MKNLKTLRLRFMDGVQLSQFLPLNHQKFLVLI